MFYFISNDGCFTCTSCFRWSEAYNYLKRCSYRLVWGYQCQIRNYQLIISCNCQLTYYSKSIKLHMYVQVYTASVLQYIIFIICFTIKIWHSIKLHYNYIVTTQCVYNNIFLKIYQNRQIGSLHNVDISHKSITR